MTFVWCYRRSLIVSATVVFAQAINSPTVVIRTIALVTGTFGGTAVAAENRSARFKISPFGWRDAYHAFFSRSGSGSTRRHRKLNAPTATESVQRSHRGHGRLSKAFRALGALRFDLWQFRGGESVPHREALWS